MAGWGTRLRPHTLTVPKPMLPLAGKPMVQHIAEGLVASSSQKTEDIVFIIRQDFGAVVEEQLLSIAQNLGARGHIRYQPQPLGTAHAILQAGDLLTGNLIVAFADTLFRSSFQIDTKKDGIIWVQQVDDPSAFGVVKVNTQGIITDLIEKPQEPVSNLAIIGIYYFGNGDLLRSEMQHLLDNNITTKGEYQLTDALENMKQKGQQFSAAQVEEWLDCGNKNATVYTNQRVLDFMAAEKLVSPDALLQNSVVVSPCYIGPGVKLINSVVGPHVSVGSGSSVIDSRVRNSIIQNKSTLKNSLIENSMVGNSATITGKFSDLSVGDYTTTNA